MHHNCYSEHVLVPACQLHGYSKYLDGRRTNFCCWSHYWRILKISGFKWWLDWWHWCPEVDLTWYHYFWALRWLNYSLIDRFNRKAHCWVWPLSILLSLFALKNYDCFCESRMEDLCWLLLLQWGQLWTPTLTRTALKLIKSSQDSCCHSALSLARWF